MGAKTGQNNFKDYQKRKRATGSLLVERALKAMPRRVRYADFHAFTRAVAMAAGLHPTTIARSKVYRQLLLDYLVAHPGSLIDPSGSIMSDAVAKAATVSVEIELASLRRENARLKKFLERQPPAVPAVVAALRGPASVAGEDFDRTATVLARVLSRLAEKEMGILADPARGEILDAAEGGSRRVIAGRPDTLAFFEWMARQPAYGAQREED